MSIYPEDFGAAGDGATIDTAAIQSALDNCAEKGGGRVVLEKKYLSGALRIGRNTQLHLAENAVLKASGELEDYIQPGVIDDDSNRGIGTPVTRKPAFVFLYANGAHNVAITGTGTIDGGGSAFMYRKNQYYCTGHFYPRPTLVYIENCRGLTVRDVTMTNASFWTLHPAGCRDVIIDNIKILNSLDWANSDGIDPDHCQNVRITNCRIECADDCICLKNTAGNSEYPHTRGVHISGCTLVSTSAAIKIGTEGVADFEDILVENCVISGSNRGISIQLRDCGSLRRAVFRNIKIETRFFTPDFWGSAEPIAVTAFDRDQHTRVGTVEDVRFENIDAVGENVILLRAERKDLLGEVVFENVNVKLVKTSKWGRREHDLRPGWNIGGSEK